VSWYADFVSSDQMRAGERELEVLEEQLAEDERALEAQWAAYERRVTFLREMRDYVMEREATLRARAVRLGVDASRLLAEAGAPSVKLSDDAERTRLEIARERDELVVGRRRICERRQTLMTQRRALLEVASEEHEAVEEALLLREQRLAEAFRRLLMRGDGGQGASPPLEDFPERAETTDESPGRASRRRFRRVEINVRVDFGSPHNFYEGETRDLCVGGLFIATRNLLTVGRDIIVRLDLAEEGHFEVRGSVAWRRDHPEGALRPGIGVRFTELEPSAAAAIGRFVAKRAPTTTA
jgi:uncharacterized protein (TIGR02266 family)